MKRKRGFFITGTDTGVGKTWVSVAMMEAIKSKGLKVLGMKPVASGCILDNGRLTNDDAILLREKASFSVPYRWVNPFAFQPPASPNIVAEQASESIDINKIVGFYNRLQAQSDFVIVEGVGGWEVPLNSEQSVADLALELDLPVILVIGLRLGCLNHGILTYNAIRDSGAVCGGWVANSIDSEFLFVEENLSTLMQKVQAPFLGRTPFVSELEPVTLSRSLNIDELLD